MSEKKNRVPIPEEVSTAVEYAADRTCCICRNPRLSLQLHHIDEDPSNNALENLALVCVQCHDDIHLKGGFGRKLDAQLVRKFKTEWEKQVVLKRGAGLKSETEQCEVTTEGNANPSQSLESIEYCVLRDADGKFIIRGAPTIFFSDRMAYTFPGQIGLRIIDDPKNAIYRLKRFLRSPIHFEKSIGNATSTDPIWYTRGMGDMHIYRLESIDDDTLLLNEQELRIKRIAPFNPRPGVFKAFVYVEVEAMPPTGAYNHSKDSKKRYMETYGYHFEEYGWLNGKAFDLRYHDDGYIEINGEVNSVVGSVRRRRYLSPYNFLIVPKFSPLKSQGLEMAIEQMLNEILTGNSNIETLADYVNKLPKSKLDL